MSSYFAYHTQSSRINFSNLRRMLQYIWWPVHSRMSWASNQFIVKLENLVTSSSQKTWASNQFIVKLENLVTSSSQKTWASNQFIVKLENLVTRVDLSTVGCLLRYLVFQTQDLQFRRSRMISKYNIYCMYYI